MSRKILSVVLPALTFLALSGTGFGVWVFQTDTGSNTEHANFEVTDAFSVSGLSIAMDSSDDEIVLDESDTDMKVKAYVTASIDFVNGLIGTYKVDDYEYKSADLTSKKIRVSYTLDSTVGGKLGDFIELSKVYVTTEDDLGTTKPFIYSKDYTYNNTNNITDTLSFSFLYKWKANKAPSTREDFSNLNTALSDTASVFKVSAEITDAQVVQEEF